MNNSDKFRSNPQSVRAVENRFSNDPEAPMEMGRGFPGGPPIEYKNPDNSLPNVDKPSKPKPKPPAAQEFADQKKEEVKQTYSTSKSDRINNAYRDTYGRNAHADEISNWSGTGMGIEDIQKGLKTSYARDGEHLKGDQLSALQIQQPEDTSPPPSQGAPDVPEQPGAPTPDREPTMDERFAGSNAFKAKIMEAKNLGNVQQNYTQQTSPNPQDPPSPPSGGGSLEQGLNQGRSRVDNMLNGNRNRYQDYATDGNDFVQNYAQMNHELKSYNTDPFEAAQRNIDFNRGNERLNNKEILKQLQRAPQVDRARGELHNLKVYGDTYRNSRENPNSWGNTGIDPVKAPDFGSIYDRTRKDIDGIKI